MQKIVVHRAGSYDRLLLEEHATPEPGEGEVRVRVHAASVNFADCAVRMGLYKSARVYVGWPITPGFDFAGEVDAVGGDTGDLQPGRRVFGVVRFGAYATHVVVPRHQLFATPEGWTDEQAAAFPVVNLTAWYGLHLLGGARRGETVLVHSAAGGVGGALLSLAREARLRAIGVVGGEHKAPVARERGASEVIVRAREDVWAAAERLAPGGFDLVMDANGGPGLRQSYAHLAPGGRLVVYGAATMLRRGAGRPDWPGMAWRWLRTPRFDPLDMTTDNKSVLAFNLSFLFPKVELLREAMATLVDLAQRGALPHPAVQTFPLARAAEAHRAIEGGDTVGKLVLTCA